MKGLPTRGQRTAKNKMAKEAGKKMPPKTMMGDKMMAMKEKMMAMKKGKK